MTITKPEFIQNCIFAYIKHHGYAPSRSHIQDYASLYDVLQEELRQRN